MFGIKELYAKKAKYENEKLFIEAKIAVVDEFIAEEQSECLEQPEGLCDATTECVSEENVSEY